MNDQPKPTTGQWTVDTIKFWDYGQIADAHNAALAAERNQYTTEVHKLYADIYNLSEVKQRLMAQLAALRLKVK